jgi:hypothetical protein
MSEYIGWLVNVVISFIAFKSLLGLHFPWETCSCCKKKYRNHNEKENENGMY